jgi:hypothetical protein
LTFEALICSEWELARSGAAGWATDAILQDAAVALSSPPPSWYRARRCTCATDRDLLWAVLGALQMSSSPVATGDDGPVDVTSRDWVQIFEGRGEIRSILGGAVPTCRFPRLESSESGPFLSVVDVVLLGPDPRGGGAPQSQEHT